jgi:hypothetical protein
LLAPELGRRRDARCDRRRASLAGLAAVRALRAQGFDGRLIVVGEEKHARDLVRAPIDARIDQQRGCRAQR